MNRRNIGLETYEWKARPSWLINPANSYALEELPSLQGTGGMRLRVSKAGRGMKWVRNCSGQALNSTGGTPYLFVCYRAENILSVRTGQTGSENYFIYVFDTEGNEYAPLYLYDLESDGQWHGIVTLLPDSEIKTIALQIQAEADDAYIEIASMVLCSKDDRFVLPTGEEFVIKEVPGLVNSLTDWFNFEYVDSYSSYPGFIPLPMAGHKYDVGIAFEGEKYDGSWFEAERICITINELAIPFAVRTASPQLVGSGLEETGEVLVPLQCSAGTIYLLLGARFSGPEEPSLGQGLIASISQVERFVVEVRYLDGASEWLFPQNVQTREHAISAGFGVYAVVPGRSMPVKELVLHDRMTNGAFYVAAVTVGIEPWQGAELPQSRPYRPVEELNYDPGEQVIEITDREVVFNNNLTRLVFSIENGLVLQSLYNRLADCEVFQTPTPVFEVVNHGITSREMTVRKVEPLDDAVKIELDLPFGRAELIGSFNGSGEVELQLSVTNLASCDETVSIVFPSLSHVVHTPGAFFDPQALWYVYPKRGCRIDCQPAEFRHMYSGQFTLQFLSFFNPECGGFYVIVQDQTLAHKVFELEKTEEGLGRLGVRYDDLVTGTLTPNETRTWPKACLGVYAGDWHHAFMAYTRWVRSWYRPLVPRKEWFRRVCTFRQQALHFAYPEKSGMFNEQNRTVSFELALARDQMAFGSLDFLHLYDWGWSPQTGRVGDYAPWKYLGPPAALRAEIEKTQEKGIPVGLYLNGYSVDPRSEMLSRDDTEWFLVDHHGCTTSISTPLLTFCLHAPKWQEYLVETCRRVCKETGAKGLYIDEFGLADYERTCYAETHGHEVPAYPLSIEGQLLQQIRLAVPEETVLYTGESPVDVISQYQDGSFTSALAIAIAEGSPHRLNLYRFAFPDFKTIELIVRDRPLGHDCDSLKGVLFNGEALWLMGTATKWFAPETLLFIQRMARIYQEHGDAFASPNPVPLYPTLVENVYANQFGTEQKNLWTVYNANFRTVVGEVLAVPHWPGAVYKDAWNERTIIPDVRDGVAYLSFSVDPKGVSVIVQLLELGVSPA